MPATPTPPIGDEKPKGTFRIISVEQRHERTGRIVMLIDGNSMGETKTDLRKRQFTYQIHGITDTTVKLGSWLLSPRHDLGVILEVNEIQQKKSRKKTPQRVALRVRFDEIGTIRLNETWNIFQTQPITPKIMRRWQRRMTEDAEQYFRHILPGVLDSVLFKAHDRIKGEQIRKIHHLQNRILKHAIRIAESQESLQLTSTLLIRSTRETLAQLKKEH